MRMIAGDVNVYWQHDTLTPNMVRNACYGEAHNSGTLVPEVGDIVHGFRGYMDAPITVRVIDVEEIGQGVQAFMVTVTDHKIMGDGSDH